MTAKSKVVSVLTLLIIVAGGWRMFAEPKAAPKFSANDYLDIQQLYARYAHALDTAQGEEFASTWVDDGEFYGGRRAGHGDAPWVPRKGRDALIEMGSRGGVRHMTSNLVITPTPDGAKGSCYLTFLNIRKTPATIVETAIYDDILVKTPQGWKFKKRVVWRDDDDASPYKPKPLPQQTESTKPGN